MNVPLFHRIGGKAAVEAAVNRFYDKFLLEPDILKFFENVDMNIQKEKLRKFFTILLGGMSDVSIESIQQAHKPLASQGLQPKHLDLWIKLTRETLQELSIQDIYIEELIEACFPYRDAIEKQLN